MKVALVHELLTMKGGAESVLKVMADMFPSAPIYTLLYDEQKLSEMFPAERVRAANINSLVGYLPSPIRFNHHLYLKKFPKAVEAWNFDEFDLVISSSSAFAHNIITNGKPKHLSYVHAPARYLWDQTHAVQNRANVFARKYLSQTFHKLRQWDAESAGRADALLAASHDVQRRIQLYWDRPSDVVHPPIDDRWFKPAGGVARENPEYFLIVSTLARYKQIDLAIKACNTLGLHLKIVGEGQDRKRLEGLAGPTIEFYGYRQGDELRDLYSDAKAVLFPGEEDFGLVPIEANACGTPVIAYRAGGALETQVEGVTAAYFDEQNPDSLAKILHGFEHKKYSKENCRSNAEKFRQSRFEQELHTHIDRLMAS